MSAAGRRPGARDLAGFSSARRAGDGGFDVATSASTFDDDWFMRHRRSLLVPLARDFDTGRPRQAPILRSGESVRLGSAARHAPGDDRRAYKELTLSRLAPRHAGAVRAHLAFYRACLESTALVASDDLIHSAVQIEWLWYSSGFKQFYRDHLAHVMKVAAIALDLLQNESGPLSRLAPLATGSGGHARVSAADWIATRLASGEMGSDVLRCAARRLGNPEEDLEKPAFWRYAMLEALKLAGLLHDMAYPSIMARKVLHAAEPANAFSPYEVHPEHAHRRAFEAIARTLVGVPFAKRRLPDPDLGAEAREICEYVLAESHSLQAGVSILRLRDQADRAWRLDPFEAFTVEWAALAASLHDYDKQYAKLKKAQRKEAQAGENATSGNEVNSRQGTPTRQEATPHTKASPEERLMRWLRDHENLEAIRPCFRIDPVSYLLAFADQIQDFGRLNYVWERVARRQPGTGEGADLQADEELHGRLVYPWRSVTLRSESIEESGAGKPELPAAALVYALSDPVGDAGGRRSSEAWRHKERDLAATFVKDGWMDSSGLFREVRFEIESG